MEWLDNLKLVWRNREKIKVVSDQVDAVRAAVQAAPATGYISSEFLTVILTALGTIYASASGHALPVDSQIVVGAVVALYAAFRTGLKAAQQLIAAYHSIAAMALVPVGKVVDPNAPAATPPAAVPPAAPNAPPIE